METSQYLDSFLKVNDKIKLEGNYVLVEKLPKRELKTKSGIILAKSNQMQVGTMNDNAPNFCVVLATGPGYRDEDGNLIEGSMGLSPGNVILIPEHSVIYYSYFPIQEYKHNTIGITRENEYQIKFNDIEEYKSLMDELMPSGGI